MSDRRTRSNAQGSWSISRRRMVTDGAKPAASEIPGSEPVVLKGRDPKLPCFVRVRGHPLLQHVQNVRNVYIAPMNVSPEKMKRYFLDFAKDMKLPPGTEEGVTAAGKVSYRRICL